MFHSLLCRYWSVELQRKKEGRTPWLFIPWLKLFWWRICLQGVLLLIEVFNSIFLFVPVHAPVGQWYGSIIRAIRFFN